MIILLSCIGVAIVVVGPWLADEMAAWEADPVAWEASMEERINWLIMLNVLFYGMAAAVKFYGAWAPPLARALRPAGRQAAAYVRALKGGRRA